MYIHGEQRCAITYSSSVTVFFSRNIFMPLFVTRMPSMSRGMRMVDYRVDCMSMYRG